MKAVLNMMRNMTLFDQLPSELKMILTSPWRMHCYCCFSDRRKMTPFSRELQYFCVGQVKTFLMSRPRQL